MIETKINNLEAWFFVKMHWLQLIVQIKQIKNWNVKMIK